MRRFLSMIIIINIILISTAGCNKNTGLKFVKENPDKAGNKIKQFTETHIGENGIYLYTRSKNEMYLFLNGYNVNNGEKAIYFTDIKAEVKDETLIINLNENYTDDYINKKIDNRVLYKINPPENIEFISIYKNGQETHFDVVEG